MFILNAFEVFMLTLLYILLNNYSILCIACEKKVLTEIEIVIANDWMRTPSV